MTTDKAVEFYEVAKQHVNSAGFQDEIRWQSRCDLREFTESDLLREAGWVVLCTGFRGSVRADLLFIYFDLLLRMGVGRSYL